MIFVYMIAAVILGIAVLLAVLLHIGGRKHRRFVETANHALQRCFDTRPIPDLTIGNSYGFPTFRLAFESKEGHQAAIDSGALARFMSELDELCRGRGTKDNPFDLKRALYCTDPEQEEAHSNWIAEDRRRFESRK